jgi:hypothetical protein
LNVAGPNACPEAQTVCRAIVDKSAQPKRKVEKPSDPETGTLTRDVVRRGIEQFQVSGRVARVIAGTKFDCSV